MTDYKLKNILREAAIYMETSKNMELEYNKNVKKYDDEISKELKGVQEARNLLKEQKKKNIEALKTQQDKLKDDLEDWKESEFSKIVEHQQPVTQDDVAELTLLGQLEVTSEELKGYAEKYKNNPLVLRKLELIARDRQLFVEFPQSKKEYAQTMVSRIKNDLSYFSKPNYEKPEGFTSMVVEGDIATHKRMAEEYEAL